MAVLQVTMVVVLLASVFVGLLRVFIGPTTGDRMLAAQLLGTGGVAVLLVLAVWLTWYVVVLWRHVPDLAATLRISRRVNHVAAV